MKEIRQAGEIRICKGSRLDKEEKERITELTAVCNKADGTCNELFLTNEFNVFPEMPCFYRAYSENGDGEPGLAGILIVYADQETTAEISAYVHPGQRKKGLFRALLHAALEECRAYGYQELEFKTEKAFAGAGEILKQYGAVPLREEYLMIWKEDTQAELQGGSLLTVRPAREGDLEAITEIQAEAFGDTPEMARRYVESSYQSRDTLLTVIEDSEKCTGCCCLDISGERAVIFGLCIACASRGTGQGGRLLQETVRLAAAQKDEVALCVEAGNETALHLYERCGFRKATEYRYFGCPIEAVSR